MRIHLGLGSNLGDRRALLRQALESLCPEGLTLVRVSPLVESPAMLPPDAPADWNRPFLNLVAEFDTNLTPAALLAAIHRIESALGRKREARWSPRPIDIDLLLYGREQIRSEALTVPHPGITERPFVLAPLIAIDPSLTIPGRGSRSVLEWSAALPEQIPLWMGIVNLTPDSFSDGGRYTELAAIAQHVEDLVAAGAHIVDFGAESTRPGATPLTAGQEWSRLAPALEWAADRYRGELLRPAISVDTYHTDVAQRAIELGVDIINDVSGLTAPAMIELAASHQADWVAMHHVTIPADRAQTLPPDQDASEAVERWLLERLEHWHHAGLDTRRVIFDPGIGFGKNPLQSLQLLREVPRFRRHGLRCLIGHSRKSFMQSFSGDDVAEKDRVTLGASLRLCAFGVDILRVHNVALHTAAWRGWAHLAR
jgi:2-amino-4-hydroxy-6-hydroxymethyldihydropteridine diphosphokinase / dihydropteroate synthase